MTTIAVSAVKATIVFPEGKLPVIDPNDPQLEIRLGGLSIAAKVNAKAARKLATWAGGAVLQGRLIESDGRLVLAEAGFTWIDPKPAETAP
jgi:hypothetical protein